MTVVCTRQTPSNYYIILYYIILYYIILYYIILYYIIYNVYIIYIIPGCEGEGTPPLLDLPGPCDATGAHPGTLRPAFN